MRDEILASSRTARQSGGSRSIGTGFALSSCSALETSMAGCIGVEYTETLKKMVYDSVSVDILDYVLQMKTSKFDGPAQGEHSPNHQIWRCLLGDGVPAVD